MLGFISSLWGWCELFWDWSWVHHTWLTGWRMETLGWLVTGEEASTQKEIQARLWDLIVWGGDEASMRPGTGSHTFQGPGAKDSGGIQKCLCAQKRVPSRQRCRLVTLVFQEGHQSSFPDGLSSEFPVRAMLQDSLKRKKEINKQIITQNKDETNKNKTPKERTSSGCFWDVPSGQWSPVSLCVPRAALSPVPGT